jgi:hypothetical protein
MPEYYKNFNRKQMETGGCIPLNTSFKLQGTHITAKFASIDFNISPCKNSTDASRPCAPQADIDALFNKHKNFYLMVHYTNPVINANQP